MTFTLKPSDVYVGENMKEKIEEFLRQHPDLRIKKFELVDRGQLYLGINSYGSTLEARNNISGLFGFVRYTLERVQIYGNDLQWE